MDRKARATPAAGAGVGFFAVPNFVDETLLLDGPAMLMRKRAHGLLHTMSEMIGAEQRGDSEARGGLLRAI